MNEGRKSRAAAVKARRSVAPAKAVSTSNMDSPAPSRKRPGESMSVRAKKIRVEYEEIFDQFKKAHDEEISSQVLSMGTGDAGQLGLGDTYLERKRPFPITDLTEIIKIRAGGMHNVCLSKSGKVLSFGCNDDFALGRIVVEDEESMVPGEVIIPSTSEIIDVTAGDSHSAVLTADGEVYIWGTFRDNASVIGLLKPTERVPEPVEVHTPHKIVKIASGENHFVMLTDMGEVLTFGCAEQGQLGRVREVYCVGGGKYGIDMLLTPAPVRVKQHVRFCDIWAGSYCTVAKSVDGDIYGCGLNNWVQLGISKEVEGSLSSIWMTKLDKFNSLGGRSWKMFVFGLHHTIALNDKGSVFVIGRGDYGNLGLGNREHQENVTIVPNLNGGVTSVAACGHVSYALKEDGTAWSWGCGNTYQLGHGDDEDATEPKMVEGKFLKDNKVIEASVGGQHVLFRTVKKDEVSEEEKSSVTVSNNVVSEQQIIQEKIVENIHEEKPVNDVPEQETKKDTKEDDKDVSKENTMDVTEEKTIDITVEKTIDIIEEKTLDITEEKTLDITEEKTINIIEEKSMDITEQKTHEVTEVKNQEFTEEKNLEVPQDKYIEVTEDKSHEATEDKSNEAIEDKSNELTNEGAQDSDIKKVDSTEVVESMEVDSAEH